MLLLQLLLLIILLVRPTRPVYMPRATKLPPAVMVVREAAVAAGARLHAARGGRAGSPAGPADGPARAADESCCGDADLHAAPQAAKDPPLPRGRAGVVLLVSVGPAPRVAAEVSSGAALRNAPVAGDACRRGAMLPGNRQAACCSLLSTNCKLRIMQMCYRASKKEVVMMGTSP